MIVRVAIVGRDAESSAVMTVTRADVFSVPSGGAIVTVATTVWPLESTLVTTVSMVEGAASLGGGGGARVNVDKKVRDCESIAVTTVVTGAAGPLPGCAVEVGPAPGAGGLPTVFVRCVLGLLRVSYDFREPWKLSFARLTTCLVATELQMLQTLLQKQEQALG